jgi:hypothetical protein
MRWAVLENWVEDEGWSAALGVKEIPERVLLS